jgi:hypothetical protein
MGSVLHGLNEHKEITESYYQCSNEACARFGLVTGVFKECEKCQKRRAK